MGAFPSTTRFAKTTPELRAAELEVLEAQADSQRAEAEVKRAEVARLNRSATVGDLRTLLPLVLGVSLAAGLALDFYRHESPSYIRRRMLATLRSYHVPPAPATSSLVASRMLPVPREPLKLGPLPTMVLGPTGCGKSTLLAILARESASLKNGARSPTPTVFVRMRLPSAVAAARDIDTHRTASLAETHQLIDSQAVAVFRQIGYPVRRATVIAVPEALKMKIITDFGFQVEFESPTSGRLCKALDCLFEVLEQLHNERLLLGEVPHEEAAPVLLLDEVQDLIKSPRLANLGGKAVFNKLAQLLVMYCVDRRVVRAAVAGSSALLSVEFERTVASGSRWLYYELPDPDERAVLDALHAHGYSMSVARDLVRLCGTRLRLLEAAVRLGVTAESAHEAKAASLAWATRQYRELFGELAPAEKGVLARVLDQIDRAEAGDASKVDPPTIFCEASKDLVARASKVMFLRLDGSLTFQSALHRETWARVRAQFTA